MSVANTPRLVFFGEQDHVVEKELYYDVVDKLDIPKSNITVFKGKLGECFFCARFNFSNQNNTFKNFICNI